MSYQRNRSNSSRSSMAPCAVALGTATLFVLCVIGAAVIMRDDFAGAIQNHEKLQEKHQELLTCEDGESCFRRGMHYHEEKEYAKAALDWEKGCDFKNGMACTNRGIMEFYGEIPEPAPERMLDFATRGCDLNALRSCQLKGDVLRKHFSNRPGAQEQAQELYVKACSPQDPSSCGYAAAYFYSKDDYEKSYEFAARGCLGDGSRNTANSCLFQALAAEKTGKSDPPREERSKTIKEGCDKYELGYFCAFYAQELAADDRERLAYMDKACHFHNSPEYCDTARKARREVTNTEARLPELQKACPEDDRVACLRIGKFYETNNALSPRERLARATEVYESLCQKRDRQGCAELRRLKKSAGR